MGRGNRLPGVDYRCKKKGKIVCPAGKIQSSNLKKTKSQKSKTSNFGNGIPPGLEFGSLGFEIFF
jgi:hypothetical protein